MSLGSEFPPDGSSPTNDGWAAYAALNPTLGKFRLRCSPYADIDRAVEIMSAHTLEPWCIFRPKDETPDLTGLWLQFAPVYYHMVTHHPRVKMLLEVWNEPNCPGTRKGLGDTPEAQIALYRRRLTEFQELRKGFRNVPLVAPGLMPGGDMRDWAVPERAQYDFDGVHIYGVGANDLMLPNGFQAEPLVTEINANEAITDSYRRQVATLEMLNVAWGYGVRRFCFFILPW